MQKIVNDQDQAKLQFFLNASVPHLSLSILFSAASLFMQKRKSNFAIFIVKHIPNLYILGLEK